MKIINYLNFLIKTKGRMNRAHYIILNIPIVISINLGIHFYDGGYIQKILSALLFVLSLISYICITIQRFHDIDLSGENLIMTFIPIVNLYFFFLLYFKRGSKGVNTYGDESLSN